VAKRTTKTATPRKSTRHAARRAVIEAAIASSPISRAGMVRRTGLSRQTVADAVDTLERQGWLLVSRQGRRNPGRTGANYELCRDAAFVFGCDLGGTKLHVALADLSGAIVAEAIEQTDQRSGQHLLAQIRAATDKLVRKAKIDRRRVHLGTIGIAGVVDPHSGGLTFGPNIPDFKSTNVSDGMRRAFGCNVTIENDVNLAVLGEHWRGRGQGIQNLAFIALGTGIGMGLLSDGNLVRGAHGAAAEIGYLPIGADPFDPRNVAAGTFEAVVGTAGILRRHGEAGGKVMDGVRGIFDAMNKGDVIARRTIEDTAKWTAIGIASVVALVDPELVILGGGIGTRPEFITRIEAHLARCLLRPVPVAPSSLENRATLMGAIAMGLGQLYGSVFGAGSLPGVKEPGAKEPEAA
jgi:predicted NBD/HSP70 family sugar kinase